MRSVIAYALDLLEQEGLSIKAACAQSVWWYPEEEIYTKLGGKGRDSDEINVDYAGVTRLLSSREGNLYVAAVNGTEHVWDLLPRNQRW